MRLHGYIIVLAASLGTSIAAQQTVAGDWVLTLHEPLASANVMRLSLSVDGSVVKGLAGGRPLEGRLNGSTLEFTSGNAKGRGTVDGTRMTGEMVFPDRTVPWAAVRVAPRPPAPRTHDFVPTAFHLYFSSRAEPVLRIHPGDTVRTWSVDAGGRDHQGVRRSPGGNPQTGPFYVEGAMPGDTLAVRLTRVRTNRDWAQSGRTIMRNALEPGTVAGTTWDAAFVSRWRLDAARNIAVLDSPTPALQGLAIPLRPMLGCVAVAPPGESSIRTTDSGSFGGNMDYNELREGTTVYLPVYHPGALLFVGDGHAAQGDGELTGDALETSMEFEFTVDVIRDSSFGHPLAENAEYIISIGIGGSLDLALQQATSGMLRWLERDYKLTATESAMLLGFSLEYDIADLVGTQVGIAAKLPKTILAQLAKRGSKG